MKWSEQAWRQIKGPYEAILEMPFIRELTNSQLPLEKFRFYMAQDSLYLEHFGRSLALIGARAHEIGDALAFMRFAENAIVVENALHASYFADFGLTDKGEIQPACHHYVHFLRSTAALEPVEIAMAAVLPCFWIYQRVGDYILTQPQTENNPYQRWIDTYGGEEFAASVHLAIQLCDAVAEQTTQKIRKQMTEAFITATRMEYAFWEAAYELRKWE